MVVRFRNCWNPDHEAMSKNYAEEKQLHERNQDELARVLLCLNDTETQCVRLRASNAELLAALKEVVAAVGDKTWGTVFALERALPSAREAIANAEEGASR